MKQGRIPICILILCLGVSLLSSCVVPDNNMALINDSQDTRLDKSYSSSYVAHDPIWIQSNEELIAQADLEEWDGNGTEDSPFVITGYSFNQETQPLRIWHTSLHWIFIDNIVDGVGSNVLCGTWIEDVSNGAIIDNEFFNRHSGIVVMDIENFTIIGNSIHDNRGYGLEVHDMLRNGTISGNTVSDCNLGGFQIISGITDSQIVDNTIIDCNGNGISITSGIYNSEVKRNVVDNVGASGILLSLASNSAISSNVVTNTTDDGMAILGLGHCTLSDNYVEDIGGSGFRLLYCSFSDISNNEIISCTDSGMEIASGENSTVFWNNITSCFGFAIDFLVNAEFFEVRYNAFYSNCVDCQISDEGTSNNVSQNYYSDWTTPDADSDGYVDEPYEFMGDADNEDLFPLAVAGIVPELPASTTTTTNSTDSTTTITQTDPDLTLQFALVGAAVIIVVILGGIFARRHR